MKHQINIRVDQFCRGWCATLADSYTAGAQYLVECTQKLTDRALSEISELDLTDNELSLIIEAAVGLEVDARHPGNQIIQSVQDHLNHGAAKKWLVSGNGLLCSLRGLTSYQIFALETWAIRANLDSTSENWPESWLTMLKKVEVDL